MMIQNIIDNNVQIVHSDQYLSMKKEKQKKFNDIYAYMNSKNNKYKYNFNRYKKEI